MTTEHGVKRDIAAPVKRVWSLLADASSYGNWNESRTG